jgi:hypothetical protein
VELEGNFPFSKTKLNFQNSDVLLTGSRRAGSLWSD